MQEPTLTGLRVVLEVGRTGSFSAAAEALGYTQSAVSRQVATTERAFGSALFERRPRGVAPTAAGAAVIRHARVVLEGVAAATQEVAGLRDRLSGRVAVGAFPTAAAALVPPAFARLLRTHPGLQVRLVEGSTPVQLTALRRGRLDVAVLASGEGLPEYDLDGLLLTPLPTGEGPGVAVPEGHPLATRACLRPGDLDDERWIVGPNVKDAPDFGVWPGVRNPRVGFEVRDWPTRLGLVAAGLGIALVPGFAAGTLPGGVRWLPVRGGDLRRAVRVATGATPAAGALAMVDALLHAAGQLPAVHGARDRQAPVTREPGTSGRQRRTPAEND